ncbi:MAG: hypothetical protein JNL74_15030 [Fibrobacteres bacterium]|nr:hypothetical protein [Fibrobacterota bacterium]
METLVKELISLTSRNNGLAPVDLEKFWAENEIACKDPFSKDAPVMACGIVMEGECVFSELGVPVDFWKYETDQEFRLSLNKAYNDKAEKIVGKRLLNENFIAPDEKYPAVKMLNDFFEAERLWESGSWWLKESAHSPEELEALLDRVEERNINSRKFMLPENWVEEKQRLIARGIKPPKYSSQRGPVTFATSVFGIENLIFLIMDKPELAARFRDLILKTMISIRTVLDEESGYTPENSPKGFSFYDDNCMMLNAEMYEFFAYPIVKTIFEKYAPDSTDWRYQHSDSAMGHHLPLLSKLNFTQVNFGPTLTVNEIHSFMPKTRVQGQLHPFTFMRDEKKNILLELLRDFEQAKERRGVVFATAGSVSNGSKLETLRLIMAGIQKYCRY